MNAVRKHLSAIKGGRLAAAAHPARVVTLVISDVPGDDPAIIASGPTVPDPSTFADARAVLEKYGITEPRAAIEHLERAADETPKPGDPRLANASTADDRHPAALARSSGRGRAASRRDAAHPGRCARGRSARGRPGHGRASPGRSALHGQPATAPVVLLSGGETTVTVRGSGRGGRNVEFLLALAVELDGLPGVFALAGDTDGVDGAEEIAGAIVTPDTLARAAERGINAKALPRRQRRPRLLRGAGRPGHHRPDADQRQRLPRHPRPRTTTKGRPFRPRTDMRRQRNAKIVATLGPASSSPEVIRSLFQAGADVFRLNFSHGTHEDHKKRYDLIRAIERDAGRPDRRARGPARAQSCGSARSLTAG